MEPTGDIEMEMVKERTEAKDEEKEAGAVVFRSDS